MSRERHLTPPRVALPALVGLLGLVLSIGVAAVLVMWWLTTLAMPGRTRVRQAAYAVVALFALNAASLSVLAVLDVRASPGLLVTATLIGLTALHLLRPPGRDKPWLDRQDAWSLGLGGLTLGVLGAPFLGATPGEAMALLSQTTDGGTHVQLVRAIARHGGYISFDHVTGTAEGMSTYPSGWAGNVWLLGHWLKGSPLTGVGTVRLVGAVVITSYALLVFLAAQVALVLSSALSASSSAVRDALTTLLVGLSTTLGFGLYLMNLSSFTQIAALVALLGAVLVLGEGDHGDRVLVLLGSASVAASQSWYLLAPPVLVLVLLAVWQAPRRSARLVALGLAIGPLVAFPVLAGPGAKQAAASGARLLPTLVGVLGLLTAGAVAATRFTRAGSTEYPIRRAWLVAFVVTLLLVCGLVLVQPADVVGPSYYAAKALLALLLLAGIGAAAAVTGAAASGWPQRALAAVVVVGLLSSTWSTRHFALPPRAAHTEGYVDPRELDALVERHPEGLPLSTDAWVVDGCHRVGDMVASKWMYDLSLTWTRQRQRALAEYDRAAGSGSIRMLAARSQDPDVRAVEVVVRRDCQPDRIAELARAPKVTVIRVP